MGTAETKELVRRITDEIWNKGDLDLVDELVAEDFVDHIELPGLEGSGRERYRQSVELVRRGFSDYHEEIALLVVEDDLAVSYSRLTGTHDGDLGGLPATGRAVDYCSCGILRLRDGVVVERWGVGDTAALFAQLGLLD